MRNFFLRQWFLVTLSLMLVIGFSFSNQLEPIANATLLRKFLLASVLFVMAFPLQTQVMLRTLARPWAAILASLINMALLPVLAWAVAKTLSNEMAVGLIVAATVPSTLASGAVWTRRAGGNDAVAMLVTVITNTLCFAVTPAWLAVLVGHQEQLEFLPMVGKLVLLVVLPMVIAQVLRQKKPLGEWATSHKKQLSVYAQLGILTMVLIGAIRTGQQLRTTGIESTLPIGDIASMIVAVIVLHVGVLFFGRAFARGLNFERADQIAIAISGSQKTLMVGLSIAIEYFGGLAILPMVTYHITQLFLDTLVADRWAKES